MEKEKMHQPSSLLNPETTRALNDCRRISQVVIKKQKPIKKERPNILRRAKAVASPGNIPKLAKIQSVPKQDTILATSVAPSFSLNTSFQNCFVIQPKPQTRSQLAQVYEYLGDISQYLFKRQAKFPPPALQYSARIYGLHRRKLVQFIIVMCNTLKLSPQTQFLALAIFHRIWIAESFLKYSLTLKAATSLYMAAKYEEPSSHKAILFCTLNPQQPILSKHIVKLEAFVLLYLDFNLSFTTPLNFIQLFSAKFQLTPRQRQKLVQLCRRVVCRQEFQTLRGSFLVMACFETLFGRLKQWLKNGELRFELDQWVSVMRQLQTQ